MNIFQPMESRNEVIIELLKLLNNKDDLQEMMKSVALFLKNWSGCEAIGIRLREGEDFPYYETLGFSNEFILKEKYLCSKNAKGEIVLDDNNNPVLECMCGNVISGRTVSSLPFFTIYGSFYTNSTTALLATSNETDRQARTRNHCNKEGYESVALVPLKTDNEIFGLLQVNDKRSGCFSLESIQFLEYISISIALALSAKKALSALRISEEIYKELYDKSPLGYQSLDANGNFLLVNETWLNTLGYSRNEVIGKWFGDFLAPEFVEPFRQRFPQFKAAGQIHSEFVMIKKDGSRCFIAFDGRIGYDEFGSFKQTHCILQDITESTRIKEALLESEELFRTAFESANIGVFLVNKEGKFITINATGCDMLGYTEDELKQLPFNSITHTDDIMISNDFYNQLINNEINNASFEKRYIHKNGSILWAHISVGKVRQTKNSNGYFVTYFQNISEQKIAEEKLRNSESNLKNANRIAKLGNWTWHIPTNTYEWSDQMMEIFGVNKASTNTNMADAFRKVLHPDDGKILEAFGKSLATNFNSAPIEYRIIAPNGSVRYIWAEVGKFTTDDNGKPLKVTGIAQDITDRKEAELALQRSEKRFRSMVENSSDSFILLLADGTITYAGPSHQKLTGYTSEERTGKNGMDLIYPDDAQIVQHTFEKVLANPGVPFKAQFRNFRKDGTIWWTAITATNLLSDPSIEAIVVNFNDITERVKTEKILLDSEARFRLVTEKSPVALYLHQDGRFTYLNPAALKMFRAKNSQELLGQPVLDRIHPDFHEIVTERIQSAKEKNIPFDLIEEKFICLDGTIIDVQVQGVPIELYGQRSILVFSQDITDRKKADQELKENEELLRSQNEELNYINVQMQRINEELMVAKEKAEESDHLKSSFLANMSHEVRTPMNAIIGFTEFLAKPSLTDEKRKRFVGLIQQRTYDLMRIIEDILDVSKIEVGQMKIINFEEYLSEILVELLDYYNLKKEKLETRPALSLKLTIADPLKHVKIITDSQRLKQIFNNLLDNAFKFTQQGLIEFGCEIKSDDTLLFFVKDTGIGIPPDKQEIIFDRFRQAEDSLTTRKYGGTGLGLSIVKGLVALMNGSIWVESQVNLGTTFFFTLPFNRCPAPEEDLLPTETHGQRAWTNKKLLIVEDDIYNVEYLKELLYETNLTILTAQNGKQTLQIFEATPYIDLVLMDIRLPDVNGLTLTKILKKSNPKLIVIAQTAYASSKDIQDCIDAGCNSYIAKPINQEKLLTLLEQYLTKKP